MLEHQAVKVTFGNVHPVTEVPSTDADQREMARPIYMGLKCSYFFEALVQIKTVKDVIHFLRPGADKG